MSRSAPATIRLTPEEEAVLRSWTRKATGEHRLAERAHIVLLSHEGESVEKIASAYPPGSRIQVPATIHQASA